MTMTTLGRRLASLEATCAATPVRYTPEEREAARLQYVEFLANPPPPDPRAVAYWERASLQQLSNDYAAMLRGAPAPWEHD